MAYKIVIKGFVDTTPFSSVQYLQGFVFGHPNFKAGQYVQVRDVTWDEENEAWRSASGKLYVIR